MAQRSLKPYREARVSSYMMFWGVLLIIALIIVAFTLMPVVSLA